MNVIWSATSPETGLFATSRRTGFQALEARFIALRSIGEGCLEVEIPARHSPQVTVSFRGDHAVVGLVSDTDEEQKSYLLTGDGSVPLDAKVNVPFMDDDAVFTGGFVIGVDRAWIVVHDFVRTGSPTGLGEWSEL